MKVGNWIKRKDGKPYSCGSLNVLITGETNWTYIINNDDKRKIPKENNSYITGVTYPHELV